VSDRRFWTDAENALLRAIYPHCHTADIAAWIGRTQGQCYQHAAALGLRKDAEYLASDTACRVSRSRRTAGMIANQFRPGLAPWNKGRSGAETGTGTHPNSRRTQFKADGSLRGAAQHNYVPIGSLRTSKDGYLERKVTDDHPVPTRRWVAVHRLVWEAANGPIPAGHIVRFKRGQKTTEVEQITTDRLECVTRVENMRRNSLHTIYPPEVAKLVQLRGALNRQINSRSKALEAA
jgi:hypothetical protein